jgi:polar amino acid transport system substrate-binding protein
MNFKPVPWVLLPLYFASFNVSSESIEVVSEDSSYSYLKDGIVSGSASEIVKATLQRAGLDDYNITIYPWARAYDIALQKPSVLIYPIIRTAAREPHFKWVGELARVTPNFYKLRERSDIIITDLQDAKNYTVGVVRDDSRQQYLKEQGFTKMVLSANNADNFQKLINRNVQIIAMTERDVILLCEESHIDSATIQNVYSLDGLSAEVYFAYSASTSDAIVSQTRESFEQLRAEGVVKQLINEK